MTPEEHAREEAEAALYRDNPMLKELHDLEKKLRGKDTEIRDALTNVDYWRKNFEAAKAEHRDAVTNLERKHRRVQRFIIHFLLWVVFLPTWLLVGIGLLVLPFWAYYVQHRSVEVFWFELPALIILTLLFAMLSDYEGKLA